MFYDVTLMLCLVICCCCYTFPVSFSSVHYRICETITNSVSWVRQNNALLHTYINAWQCPGQFARTLLYSPHSNVMYKRSQLFQVSKCVIPMGFAISHLLNYIFISSAVVCLFLISYSCCSLTTSMFVCGYLKLLCGYALG